LASRTTTSATTPATAITTRLTAILSAVMRRDVSRCGGNVVDVVIVERPGVGRLGFGLSDARHLGRLVHGVTNSTLVATDESGWEIA
jgi:hypothetical protein